MNDDNDPLDLVVAISHDILAGVNYEDALDIWAEICNDDLAGVDDDDDELDILVAISHDDLSGFDDAFDILVAISHDDLAGFNDNDDALDIIY